MFTTNIPELFSIVVSYFLNNEFFKKILYKFEELMIENNILKIKIISKTHLKT